MRNISKTLTLFGFAFLCGKAEALQYISGRVTSIEATYMPAQIPFVLTAGNAACPAGKPVYWANPNLDNNKAIYAALVTSLTTGKKITFIIDDNDVSCNGRFLYLED
ncbi:hypothetical protein IPT12_19005 [Xanthomonas perforans]|uniref:Uncharacterized protein n=3 Tax=Xanthomonas TaxID=338 RepID=A0A1L5R7M7_XANPE|nr:hypothetical protein [Xanthomonas euvesicatoria]APP00712.1 hypothetical protein BJD13_17940 [Xanthomonas perforans]AQS77157.1 hypothetical protein XPE_13590 [Xanthomonas perforans 91-118]MBZ2414506.1 hypothetical protein [Xanthomonas perforans]MBZ2419121.1 hypothetical protein [Xanthomonas perforans]MBZ2423165.1 hypothetical protein [Xanthomonas perforans]